MKRTVSSICFLMILLTFQVSEAQAQMDFAGYTYQGSLKDGNAPASGSYDLKFEFYDVAAGGASLGSYTFTNHSVVNGVFTVVMTGSTGFMSPGRNLWIETSVRPAGSGSPLTILTPRQRIYSSPFAISSLLTYDSLRLGGVEANQYLTTTSGATSFIQNGAAQQTGSFNLNGTGTANILNAATQFDIGGNRILSAGGADNIFAGFQAGQANTTGTSNSFFGMTAGGANTTGISNAFFGKSAGNNNNIGNANSFFGYAAGFSNSNGSSNAFFGVDAGRFNVTGSNNTIVGGGANVTVNNLTNATALGYRAAVSASNSLVLGGINGVNGGADTNVGIGINAPTQRLHVVGNGVFTGNLGVGTISPTFKLELIDSSNTGLRVQTTSAGGTVASFGGLGAFRVDAAGTPGGRFSILENGNTGFGTNAPNARLSVLGGGFGANLFVSDSNTVATTFDLGNTSTGARTWRFQSNGSGDASRTGNLELWNVGGANALGIRPNGNVGIGTTTPVSRLHVAGGLTVNGGMNYFDTGGSANFFMKSAGAANGINFGVVGNAGTNSTLYIAHYDGTTYQDRLIIDSFGVVKMPRNVVVGTDPTADRLYVNGFVSMNLGTFGTQAVCRNTTDGVLTTCSSSIRYKQNIEDYKPGLELIRRLRPVSFNWKVTNEPDFGLVAEETAEVEPLLVTKNDKGEIEGVKYDRVGVVLVNAVNEQQTQIEAQQKQIDGQAELIKTQHEKLARQQSEIEALKAIVCSNNRSAEICREK